MSQQKERVVIPENKTYSTDFNKVGRSILANTHTSNLVYSQNDRFTPTIETNQASNSYPNFYSKTNTIEPVKNNNPYMNYGIPQKPQPTYQTSYTQQPQQMVQETPKYSYSRPPWGGGYGVRFL